MPDDTGNANPAAIDAEVAAGLALHQKGRLQDAAVHYRRALAADPDHAEANNLLGVVLLASGDSPGAAKLTAKAVAAKPDNPQYRCNYGTALNAVTDSATAVLHLNRAIALKPDYAEAYANRGMSFKLMWRPADAIESYRKAIELKPEEAGFHSNLGNSLFDLGALDEAEASYRRALALRPNYPAAARGLSNVLDALGRTAEAEAVAPASDTKRSAVYYRERGRTYRLAGKLALAERTFRKAVSLDRREGDAWHLLSQLRRRDSYDDELKALERLVLEPELTSYQRTNIRFALGRWLADLGEPQKSFDSFRAANAEVRASLTYSVEKEARDYEIVRQHFDPVPESLPTPIAGDPAPIFIVGLPRSGKSTLEGILARHPEVKAAGELRILGLLARELSIRNGLSALGSHIGSVSPEELAALAAQYMDFVRAVVPAPYVPIDTMPPNYRLIGLIRLALPNARILHTVRDPVEQCAALFEKRFPKETYEFTYDLGETARFHRIYQDLVGYWRQAFPGFIHDVDVAGLGTDEPRLRAILAFCGLEWTPAVLGEFRSEPRLGESLAGPSNGAERRRLYESLLGPLLSGGAGV